MRLVAIIGIIKNAPLHWLGFATESPGFAAKAAPAGFASGAIFVGGVSTANEVGGGFVAIININKNAPLHWLGFATESPGFAAKAAPTGFASGAIFVGGVSTANEVDRGFVAIIGFINNAPLH